ncbi:Amidophosphoribosyltransferase [uncultured archaeon]|nr:Amidophosphoribosyltransferase [uncultured archaeon]
MCGIAGTVAADSESLVRKMLEVIKHRGPDGSGVISSSSITLGNVLLKITGNKTQPVHNGGALTYNGEIYNFKEIAEKLDLKTGSDSDALFALIKSKGTEAAVQELDGDYAFAYLSGDGLELARDPAGVKPLYYGYSEGMFAFASEKKALLAIGMNTVFPLKPGNMLLFTHDKIVQKKIACFAPGKRITDENEASEHLFTAIGKAVKKRRYIPSGIAFSGGLDSSLIAALSRDSELFTVGMAGSHDIHQSKKAAQILGLPDKLHLHELTPEEIESAVIPVIRAIESSDPLKVSIAMPLFFASKDANDCGIRVMLSGQGADELFGGYKRYESLAPGELETALRHDLDNIAENNLERDDAVTMANAVELRVPYLDREVVELALGIDPGLKISHGIRKYILRKAAGKILPSELALKEKKAAQYSSGIYSALLKIAKKNGFRGDRFLGRYLEEMKSGL